MVSASGIEKCLKSVGDYHEKYVLKSNTAAKADVWKTGSGKLKMAASKLEMYISQCVHEIATKFQRLYLCFRGPAIQ
jgi:hypothetical protein